MFKLIKLDFYDSFKCLMSECTDNCCDEDWDIYIDDETYELYKKIGILDLDSHITSTVPRKLIKKDHKCPFITPEGLCLFHRDYGEEYLSNTCRSYPRFVSSYGDVYLETLGLSCPATVSCVLKYEKEIEFPDNIYYEENDQIGIKPDRSDAERTAYAAMKQFVPNTSVTGTYLNLIGDLAVTSCVRTCSADRMLTVLKDIMKGTPSERYVNELFPEDQMISGAGDILILDDEKIIETEKQLIDSNSLFCCNMNRMIMFEHMMLDSQSDHPDSDKVFVKGLIVWILLLMTFGYVNEQTEEYNGSRIVDHTYKLMRITDHGDNVLDAFLNRMSL